MNILKRFKIYIRKIKIIILPLAFIIFFLVPSFDINTNVSKDNKFIFENSEKIKEDVFFLTGKKIEIEYILPQGIYGTKDMLFKSFFKDFYDYINKKEDGKDLLLENKIYSVNDFYTLALKMDKKEDAPSIGRFGKYFIKRDVFGELREQKNSFLGECLKKGKYVDFIYFLKEFFYHWRIDEGYAGTGINQDVYGSNFLADPRDSLIDTTKFFYYDLKTLPNTFLTTKNLKKLYGKIPGVILDGDLAESFKESVNLSNSIRCVGYKFRGYYRDKDFKEKIEDNTLKRDSLENFEKDIDEGCYKIKIYINFIKE